MAFSILKLSYNEPGDPSLTGGICGTGFFVDASTAVTAHHVLNEATLAPNAGYKNVLLWMISRNGPIRRIDQSCVDLYPDIDTSVMLLQSPQSDFVVYDVASRDINAGTAVHSIGYEGNAMPRIDAQWQGRELVIRSANLAQAIQDRDGHVNRSLTLHINANDIKMQDVRGFELSFGSQVGMSGGPVVDIENDCVIGMLSIGLPADVNVKTQTFAVSINEIMDRI
ncbi:MAG: serine protease [Deltaproteobacteria bacterium]|nr:serine protease [Deltaproteobacteria bacterium]